MSENRIGLVGLGAMGMGMAKSLRRKGYSMHVFDVGREVAEAFAAEGGVACDSPGEVATIVKSWSAWWSTRRRRRRSCLAKAVQLQA